MGIKQAQAWNISSNILNVFRWFQKAIFIEKECFAITGNAQWPLSTEIVALSFIEPISLFSSGGGLILSFIVNKFKGIAVFNPVIIGKLKQLMILQLRH